MLTHCAYRTFQVGCLWTDALFAFTREWMDSPLHSGLLALALLWRSLVLVLLMQAGIAII